jgi:hypothetical protein
MSIPFENQRAAADEVIDHFTTTEVRHVLLHANEQAGKTGTYHNVIGWMLANRYVDRAYILCGSNETELRNQCIQDVQEWHCPAMAKQIKVVFRQDFKRVKMTTERTLIVVDETHLVQQHDQTLSKYLHDHDLSMTGTTDAMILGETYLLSVDATPYAEMSAILHHQSRPKAMVTLKDGHGYFGVKEYSDHKLIRPTFSLKKESGQETFRALLRRFPNKYILIRAGSKKSKEFALLQECARLEGCAIKYFTSAFQGGQTQITVTKLEAEKLRAKHGVRVLSMEEAPPKTTIVFLDGRLRCGKRLPKRHIGMVWENTTNARTDIIRQGLLGRICGYLGEGLYHVPVGDNKPIAFVSDHILKREATNKVVQDSDLERSFKIGSDILPRFANNIIAGRVQNKATDLGAEIYPCVPILFRLTPVQTERLAYLNVNENQKDKLILQEYCFNLLIERHARLWGPTNQNLTKEQQEEIATWLANATAEDCNIRNYKEKSNDSMHKSHIEAYKTSTIASEHINGTHGPKPFLTFCVVYDGFQPMDQVKHDKQFCSAGTVFTIFHTKSQGYDRCINKLSRIPRVNNKTHFTIRAGDEMIGAVAGAAHGIRPLARTDPATMMDDLELFVALSKQPRGIFSKRIEAFNNAEDFKLPKRVYGENLEVFREICRIIEGRYQTKITIEMGHLLGSPNHKIRSISWT